MSKKSIQSNQLTPNKTYLVRGKVGFSRISRHTTDQERNEANAKRTHPITKNYTTLTIYDATVLCKDKNNPTIEEMYAAESLYKSSSPKYPGANFTGINKTRNLPQVGVLTPVEGNPSNYAEIIPEGELASGLDVTLVMRVYKGQGSNNGVSLDRVLVNEPIKYYGGNAEVDKTLSEFGITFTPMPPSQKPAPVENDAVATTAAPVQTDFAASAYAQPAATAAPAPVENAPAAAPEEVTGNPFSSYSSAPDNIQFGAGGRQY